MKIRMGIVLGLTILLVLTQLIGCRAPSSEVQKPYKLRLTYEESTLNWEIIKTTGLPVSSGSYELNKNVTAEDLRINVEMLSSEGKKISSPTYAIEDAAGIILEENTARIKLRVEPNQELDPPIDISGIIKPQAEQEGILSMWAWWAAMSLIVIALGVSIGLIIRRKAAKPRLPVTTPYPPTMPKAKLLMPGNIEIVLAGGTMLIGRGDLARAAAADNLKYISRKHFLIEFINGQYHIEDQNSTNGTKLNGIEIKGKGKYILKDGDQIVITDVLTLTFRTV